MKSYHEFFKRWYKSKMSEFIHATDTVSFITFFRFLALIASDDDTRLLIMHICFNNIVAKLQTECKICISNRHTKLIPKIFFTIRYKRSSYLFQNIGIAGLFDVLSSKPVLNLVMLLQF